MEGDLPQKMGDEISLQTTVNLLDDFGRKKLYFEETIGKLKKFQPNSISPNVNTSKNRSSPRITASKNDDKTLDQFDVSVILNQMKYLFDTNMQLITIVKNLHTKYDVIINNNSETIKSNDNLKNEISKIQEEIEIVSDKNKKMQEQISKPKISIDNSDLVNSLQEKNW